MDTFSLLIQERIASIRDIQKNPSQALQGITRITRGSQTIGFFLSNEHIEELMENREAQNSKPFLRRISKARKNIQKAKGISLEALAKEYGL